MTSRRSEAPPRGKHDTRLLRFRKRATLHPKQLRFLKALDRLKAEGKPQSGSKLRKLSAPPPASAPPTVENAPRNFGEFLKSLPPGTKLRFPSLRPPRPPSLPNPDESQPQRKLLDLFPPTK